MSEKTIIDAINNKAETKADVVTDKKTETTPVVEKSTNTDKVKKQEVAKKAEVKSEVKSEVKTDDLKTDVYKTDVYKTDVYKTDDIKVESKKPVITNKAVEEVHGEVIFVSEFSYIVRDKYGHGININGRHNKKVGDLV